MDEGKADELYRSFKQYDQAARFKQGLGFGAATSPEPAQRDRFSARDPVDSFGNRHEHPPAGRRSPVPRHSDQSQGRQLSDGVDGDRWVPDGSLDTYRRTDERSSRENRGRSSRNRSRSPADKVTIHYRREPRGRSRAADERRRTRSSSRSPRRSDRRSKHRSHSRSPRHCRADRRHRQRSRSRSPFERRSHDQNRRQSPCTDRRHSYRRSSRSPLRRRRSPLMSHRARSSSRDRHDRRLRDVGDRRTANGLTPSDEAAAAQPKFEELIEGYNQMTPAMRLKSKTRYMLTQATKRAEDTGDGQWTRFEFDPSAATESGDVALDARELRGHIGGATQADTSHEAAIFGLPGKGNTQRSRAAVRAVAELSESDDDEDGPQIVELPNAMPENISDRATAPASKPSWREKASLIKAKREAEIKANTPLLKFAWN